MQKLSNDYLTQLKTQNTQTITADLIDEDINVSENMIGRHMKELSDIRSENKTLKMIAVFSLIVIFILLIIVLLLRKRITLLKN